jgi:ribosomal protein L16/L10AE
LSLGVAGKTEKDRDREAEGGNTWEKEFEEETESDVVTRQGGLSSHQNLEEARQALPRAFQGSTGLAMAWFQTSGLQSCESTCIVLNCR